VKVITQPRDAESVQVEGAVLVCRWNTGYLTSFRYHGYKGVWYGVGQEETYTLSYITKNTIILAAFMDEE